MIKMTSAVATLLASMAEKLQRSDLAICQTLSNALDAGGRNNLHIPPLSPQHAKKSLDYIARACPDSSSCNILMIQQCASYLSWRQPGFGHVPQAVAKHLAVCEIIGPTGQITHDSIRAGLFRMLIFYIPVIAMLPRRFICRYRVLRRGKPVMMIGGYRHRVI
jgi:hypothetical protein